ncbi:hypothetical protein Tco_1547065 [Tanacetum coccineum]
MPKSNKEKKSASNLKRTARISARPCCFNNPHPLSPPYQDLSPPTDYQAVPSPSPNVSPPLSLITTPKISPSKLLLTPKSSPSPLTSPLPVPTQPSKHSSPLSINLDPVELIFSTPLMRFLALGWHLEEIHITWAHLEKKRIRPRFYIKNHEELFTQSLETAPQP